MVQAAETDVIGPAVAPEKPVRAFDEKIAVFVDVPKQSIAVFVLFQRGNQPIGTLPGPGAAILMGQPFTAGRAEFIAQSQPGGCFNLLRQLLSQLLHAQHHAEAVFGVVLK